MTFEQGGDPADPVMENIRGTYDALNVRRVFGDPYQADGVTVIPVARVAGGAGGGGGKGTHEGDTGHGFGTGFGVQARPVGVYEVRGSSVVWKPAVDVNRLARGGQVLGGIVIVCATLLLLRRGR
jgi:uncharacterized spore protein YtfJ